jgi:hypothetical protein
MEDWNNRCEAWGPITTRARIIFLNRYFYQPFIAPAVIDLAFGY